MDTMNVESIKCPHCGDKFTTGAFYWTENHHCWGCHKYYVIAEDTEKMIKYYQRLKAKAEKESQDG